MLPIGLITNCLAVLVGGLFGALLGPRFPQRISTNIIVIFGFSAMAIGINSIVKTHAMTPVIIAVILGTLLGEFLDLQARITRLAGVLVKYVPHHKGSFDMEHFITIVVIFCASGFGIFGALTEGMSGDSSFLLSKAVLDFFTATVFAVTLGAAVAFISLPMALVMGSLYLPAGVIAPLINPVMLQDFIACGGILTLAAGLRVSAIKHYPIANMIPSLVLVLPVSAAWTALMG